MEKECKHLYRLYGRLPSEVMGQTPHQLFAVMFVKRGDTPTAVPLNSLEALTRTNRMRAEKGLPPVTGRAFSSVMQSVPNAR